MLAAETCRRAAGGFAAKLGLRVALPSVWRGALCLALSYVASVHMLSRFGFRVSNFPLDFVAGASARTPLL